MRTRLSRIRPATVSSAAAAGKPIHMTAEVRIVVRPYATSLALGFFAFGIGMLLLGGVSNGWLHASDRHTVGLLLAAFVFPLELVAAIFAFLARDSFGATGLGLFATSWLFFFFFFASPTFAPSWAKRRHDAVPVSVASAGACG